MPSKKKTERLIISKEELRVKPRLGVKSGRIFKDKTKYSRKPKHKKSS